jgi:hypothetical protein
MEMRRGRYHDRAQLVLELGRQSPQAPMARNPNGLVEALADLLLEALGVDGTTKTGGEDEHPDHA